MIRVLAPGGRLMNCDANYGAAFREADRPGEAGELEESVHAALAGRYEHPAQSLEMLRERNDIASQLNQQPDPSTVGCRYTDQPGNEIHNRRYEY